MCLICMTYRIIFLIIMISSLGQILLSYIANTSRTRVYTHVHACTRTRANACTHTHAFAVSLFDGYTHPRERVHTHTAVAVSLFDGSVPANRDARSDGDNSHWNQHWHWRPGFPEVLSVFRIKKNAMPN